MARTMALDDPSRPEDSSDPDEPSPHRTPVADEYDVRLPPSVREHLDLEPGDELRWTLTADGGLAVEKVDGEWGAFDDFEPVDMGETDSVEEHDLAGAAPEYWP